MYDRKLKELTMDIKSIIKSFREEKCPCGRVHETSVKDVRIGSGLVNDVGAILAENGFPKKILLVADKDTLAAANGIIESLSEFDIEYKIYDRIRVARMEHVNELCEMIRDRDIALLGVGTGSVHDPCRLAAARENKKLCLFGTAPSMDGFASYSSPIVDGYFKASYAAKSPEVIIGDTAILAKAPTQLKSSGFGDMVAKYVGLIDWQISTLLTGEYYCEKIASLTRLGIDTLMGMADRVTVEDEETAGKIFEALLMTGLGMSFAQNSRPASGCEHVVAHLIECFELLEDKEPNFHGEDVGVATLEMLKLYSEMAKHEKIHGRRETVDWNDVYATFGPMADDVRKLNEPKTVADEVDPAFLEENWQKVRDIIASVPSYEECREKMKLAGCKLTVADIGKPQALFDKCVKYSPYMRYRMTLLRIRDMIELL